MSKIWNVLKSLYIQERTLHCWAPPSILDQIHHPISQRITTKSSRKHAYRPSFARETRFCSLFSCLKLPQWWKTRITVKTTSNLANVMKHDNVGNQWWMWPKHLFFTTKGMRNWNSCYRRMRTATLLTTVDRKWKHSYDIVLALYFRSTVAFHFDQLSHIISIFWQYFDLDLPQQPQKI